MESLELNPIIDLKREGKSFYWASFFLPKKTTPRQYANNGWICPPLADGARQILKKINQRG